MTTDPKDDEGGITTTTAATPKPSAPATVHTTVDDSTTEALCPVPTELDGADQGIGTVHAQTRGRDQDRQTKITFLTGITNLIKNDAFHRPRRQPAAATPRPTNPPHHHPLDRPQPNPPPPTLTPSPPSSVPYPLAANTNHHPYLLSVVAAAPTRSIPPQHLLIRTSPPPTTPLLTSKPQPSIPPKKETIGTTLSKPYAIAPNGGPV
ncbi:MAG: hypothetical protein Q9171_006826, partial [Xanthocarpia ochracea]